MNATIRPTTRKDTPPTYHAVETAIAYARLARCVLVLARLPRGQPVLPRPARALAHPAAAGAHLAIARWSLPHKWRSWGLRSPQPGEAGTAAINLPPCQSDRHAPGTESPGSRTIFSRELPRGPESHTGGQTAGHPVSQPARHSHLYLLPAVRLHAHMSACDLPLTFHTDSQNENSGLVCHTCNYRRHLPKTCPECSSPHIRQFGPPALKR